MWECVVLVFFDRIEGDETTQTSRTEVMHYPRGRLPTKDEIGNEAMEAAAEWLASKEEYFAAKGYDYSPPTSWRIVGCVYIP